MAAWFAAGVPKSGTLHKSLVQTSNSALRQTPALQTRRYPQQGAEASPKPASMPVLGTGAASRQRHSKASVALEQTMYSRMSHAAASRHVLSEEATQSQAPNQCMGKEARPRDKRRPQTLEGRRMRRKRRRKRRKRRRRRTKIKKRNPQHYQPCQSVPRPATCAHAKQDQQSRRKTTSSPTL
ncbi:unnamed protein product [Prorocentrum cordatum]|uniref:Uncharacterized protein n=1 Tax=Prorocentrum cordatum TaxID=2364126 RepID=A0ABN9PEM7_9DINO|nr:unnamed protein product [Polarella glacialis]